MIKLLWQLNGSLVGGGWQQPERGQLHEKKARRTSTSGEAGLPKWQVTTAQIP